LTACAVDHLQYLLDIHENNAIVLYSDALSKQIPKSYAANAFNVFREAMHQIEIVRICALWDQGNTIDRESIMTVVELIDDPKVLDALADQARGQLPPQLADQRAAQAVSALKDAIQEARKLRKAERLKSIRDLRNKHVAHYLTEKAEDAENSPAPMKHGDESQVIETSIAVVEALNSYVNGVGLSFEDCRAIDQKCASALWQACTFKIEQRALHK
jgi:AbiU2